MKTGLWRQRKAASGVEYALLLGLLALAVAGGIAATGGEVEAVFCRAASVVTGEDSAECRPADDAAPEQPPVTLAAYGYAVDCPAATAECRGVPAGGGVPQAVAPALCLQAPDAAGLDLLQQAGLAPGGPASSPQALLDACPATGPELYAWRYTCSGVAQAGFACHGIDRDSGTAAPMADSLCENAAGSSADEALLAGWSAALPAGTGWLSQAQRAGFDAAAACPTAQSRVFGWQLDCFEAQANCQEVVQPQGGGAATLVAASDADCSAAPAAQHLPLLEAQGLLPGSSEGRTGAYATCPVGLVAHGWSVSCAGGMTQCQRIEMISVHQRAITNASPADCAAPQTAEQLALARAYDWAVAAEGLTAPQALAQCSGVTGYGWAVDCAAPAATCRMATAELGNAAPSLANASAAACATAQSGDSVALAESASLVPGTAGATATGALALCESPELLFGWQWTCPYVEGQMQCDDWETMENCWTEDPPPVRPVYNCTGYRRGNTGLSVPARAQDCADFEPQSGDAALLASLGLLSDAERRIHDPDSCNSNADWNTAYGWSVDCAGQSASCAMVESGTGMVTPADAADCATAGHWGEQQLASERGLVPGGVTAAVALEACDAEPDRIYGFQVDCETNMPSCWGIDPAAPQAGQMQADAWHCHNFVPDAAQLATLNASDLMSAAQLPNFDFDSCSPPWVQATWMMVAADGASTYNCDGTTRFYPIERWACMRNGTEIVSGREGICGPKADADAAFNLNIGQCAPGYWGTEYSHWGWWEPRTEGSGSESWIEIGDWNVGSNVVYGQEGVVSSKAADEVIAAAYAYCQAQGAQYCGILRDGEYTQYRTRAYAFFGDIQASVTDVFYDYQDGVNYVGAGAFSYRPVGGHNTPFERIVSLP